MKNKLYRKKHKLQTRVGFIVETKSEMPLRREHKKERSCADQWWMTMLLNATLHFKNKHYKKIGGHASFCAVFSVQICSFLCLFFVPDLCLLSSQPYHSCITQSWSGCMEEEEGGREKQRVTVYFPIPGRGEKKSACLARLCAPALLQQRENIYPIHVSAS